MAAEATVGARRRMPPPRFGVTNANAEPVADEVLVRAAQAGDRRAFGALYERFGSMVHGILLANGPPEEADDLVQDVFATAMQRLSSLREPAAFGAWIASIARNRMRMHTRRSVKLVPVSDDLPEPRASNSLEANEILRAIASLPAAYREPLILRLVEGFSGEEIAARTGLTPGSVRVNLHRGMKQLRQKLEG